MRIWRGLLLARAGWLYLLLKTEEYMARGFCSEQVEINLCRLPPQSTSKTQWAWNIVHLVWDERRDAKSYELFMRGNFCTFRT